MKAPGARPGHHYISSRKKVTRHVRDSITRFTFTTEPDEKGANVTINIMEENLPKKSKMLLSWRTTIEI